MAIEGPSYNDLLRVVHAAVKEECKRVIYRPYLIVANELKTTILKGVYIVKGQDGEVLYVGRSDNIIARLKDHFSIRGSIVRSVIRRGGLLNNVSSDEETREYLLEIATVGFVLGDALPGLVPLGLRELELVLQYALVPTFGMIYDHPGKQTPLPEFVSKNPIPK